MYMHVLFIFCLYLRIDFSRKILVLIQPNEHTKFRHILLIDKKKFKTKSYVNCTPPPKKKNWDRVYIEYLAVFSVGWLDMNTSLILDPPPIPFSEPNYIKIV